MVLSCSSASSSLGIARNLAQSDTFREAADVLESLFKLRLETTDDARKISQPLGTPELNSWGSENDAALAGSDTPELRLGLQVEFG